MSPRLVAPIICCSPALFIFVYFQEELIPVQNALETMESTNKQLRSLIGRYKVDPNLNINPLSMKLGGIIDAAVMGGVSNFEKVSSKIRFKPWFV